MSKTSQEREVFKPKAFRKKKGGGSSPLTTTDSTATDSSNFKQQQQHQEERGDSAGLSPFPSPAEEQRLYPSRLFHLYF